jgi:ABC-type amino acid transport system permease subunit
MTSGFLGDLPLYASGLLTTLTVSLAGIALSVGIGIVLAAALRNPCSICPFRYGFTWNSPAVRH